MSIYLYLHCRDCDEFTGVIGRNSSGDKRWYIYTGEPKYMNEVDEFLVRHMGCNVTLVDEFTRSPESPPWGYKESDT
jgi:hypothetical protein